MSPQAPGSKSHGFIELFSLLYQVMAVKLADTSGFGIARRRSVPLLLGNYATTSPRLPPVASGAIPIRERENKKKKRKPPGTETR